MSSTSWLENVFREARQDFLAQVPRQHHLEFSKFGTIDAVYTEINDIQLEQSKTRTLVALTRIEPYINGLQEYFGVVDTFVQVNPEILCLVWVSTDGHLETWRISSINAHNTGTFEADYPSELSGRTTIRSYERPLIGKANRRSSWRTRPPQSFAG